MLRKLVKWKDPCNARESHRLPIPYIPDIPIHSVNIQLYKTHLLVGALWHTCENLEPDLNYSSVMYNKHELDYLVPNMWNTTDVRIGTPCIYLGTVRVEEYVQGGSSMALTRIQRHSFLIGGKRYMIRDLNTFSPVF